MKTWRQYKGLLKLAGMIVMVPLVAWLFGFRQTVKLWRECSVRQETVHRLSANKPEREEVLQEGLSGKQVLNNGVLLEQLGGTVRDNGVKVVKYTPYLTRQEGALQVHTGELVLSGNFTSLLKVMQHVEKKGNSGKIISAGFRLYDDRVRKERQLRMTLVIQQLTIEN